MRRRTLLGAGLSGLGGLMLPHALLGSAQAAAAQDRYFLFLYVEGGWDPAVALTPMFDIAGAWTEPGSALSTVNGLSFVDSSSRPSIAEFFGRWGDQVALVHGMEVPSITHERCQRLLLTGTGDALEPDWPTRLAGSPLERPIPHLVMDGPAFSGDLADRVVRLGSEGQLPLLMSGEITEFTDTQAQPPSSQTSADIDAMLASRSAARAQGQSGEGQSGEGQSGEGQSAMADHAQAHLASLDGVSLLQRQAQGLSLDVAQAGCTRDYRSDLETIFTCFDGGLSRCAMLRHKGWCDQGWDTHQQHERQFDNWEDLGQVLVALMELRERWASVSERLVVVVASEMGRHPTLNNWGGKDHWTWTSFMMLGDGVRPGQYGGLDSLGRGSLMDLASGAPSDTGTALRPENLGATLLSLGGLDPGPVGEPIGALLL